MGTTLIVRKPKRKWRVWIEQVNQTYVDVVADDMDDAVEKAERKWKRECEGPRVSSAKEIT